MESRSQNESARESILQSIRQHLEASRSFDQRESELAHVQSSPPLAPVEPIDVERVSLVDVFKNSLEAVDGHCILVQSEQEVVQALTETIRRLQQTKLLARRIAISDAPDVERLIRVTDLEVDELEIAPSASEVFRFDVGISQAQAGIAETGTLLLDSSRERHRLVSLVPPVHIAIINASQIVETLGEALAMLRREHKVSPIVTLVTGPSRTADIELTLAIGVHGPQELFVIVNQDLRP